MLDSLDGRSPEGMTPVPGTGPTPGAEEPVDEAAPPDETAPPDEVAPTDETAPPDETAPTDETALTDETAPMDEAVRNLRALIMAGERYRMAAAGSVGVGTTESQAISYLAVHGARGQSELARDLSLTSSAATALVDRLERHGAAERARHPSDRRRTLIRLTAHGERLAAEGQQPLIASLGLVAADDLRTVAGWLGLLADDLHARTRAVPLRPLAPRVG